jgi:hypothetical protein
LLPERDDGASGDKWSIDRLFDAVGQDPLGLDLLDDQLSLALDGESID